MNERQREIQEIKVQQNKEIRDKIEDRIRLFNTLKIGYEQLYKDSQKKEERKVVHIDEVPEELRNNPLILLRYGFSGMDSDAKTKSTVIKPESGALEATEKETQKTADASPVEVVEVSAHDPK